MSEPKTPITSPSNTTVVVEFEFVLNGTETPRMVKALTVFLNLSVRDLLRDIPWIVSTLTSVTSRTNPMGSDKSNGPQAKNKGQTKGKSRHLLAEEASTNQKRLRPQRANRRRHAPGTKG